jgi:hypothetical protein
MSARYARVIRSAKVTLSRAIGNEVKGETMKNEELGNSIPMKTSEQLIKEGGPTIAAPVVGERNVMGNTFAEITRKSPSEYKPSYVEKIPETVSLDQLRSAWIARLDGQNEPQ